MFEGSKLRVINSSFTQQTVGDKGLQILFSEAEAILNKLPSTSISCELFCFIQPLTCFPSAFQGWWKQVQYLA